MGETKTGSTAYLAYERGPFTVRVNADSWRAEEDAYLYLRGHNFFGETFRRQYEATLPLVIIRPLTTEEVHISGNGQETKLISHLLNRTPERLTDATPTQAVHLGQLSLI